MLLEEKQKVSFHLNIFFGFSKTFKKITKNLGFHPTFKTADLQDIIFTTLGDAIKTTVNNFYLYVPIFIFPVLKLKLCSMTQSKIIIQLLMILGHQIQKQLRIDETFKLGSAQNINSPKYLIVPHQTLAGINVPNKANSEAIFVILDVRNYVSEKDGQRNPNDAVVINYTENHCLDRNRDVKFFYKESLGEELLNPFKISLKMRNFYPIQVFDLRFQVDYITLKKIQLIEEDRNDPADARLYIILIRYRKIEMISDGNKIADIKFL